MVHKISDGDPKPHSDELATIKAQLDDIMDAVTSMVDQIAEIRAAMEPATPPEQLPDPVA